ncbi:hypothetical protein A33Q_0146 [Indibacter alkaliphilus LW1]|uniref:Uncharacterized protein n=1 Tax=Indibacter alkaliphilus (strain CCUG 57479 / KCTC 22604 / LW1) TaxID=1189612 RepID=S2DMC4_INDAL|nr:hypothetical protein [Indibacter alkaliphilus]EPA00275.1 hypothetical protein A33Q_0146 [Indibacter alkaliphilus LW1]
MVNSEGKSEPVKSTAIIDGSEVYVTEVGKNSVMVSSYDPVGDIPDGYNSNSGYSYDALDLKVRHRLKGTSLWSLVANSEASGTAGPIHSQNAVREYMKKYGTNSSLFYAVEEGYFSPAGSLDITKSAHGLVNKIGSSAVKQFNVQPRWQGVQTKSGSSNPWNQFLKENKGKYSGSGWQQRALEDYKKLRSGN